MGTFRLYTGPDGQGRIETIDIEKKTDWLKGLPTSQISFSVWPVGRFLDWHPAPRRQFVIILQGQLEIGLGDGSKHVFGPGDARLVEDTTGQGHTTRVVSQVPVVTATIPLAQQGGDPDPWPPRSCSRRSSPSPSWRSSAASPRRASTWWRSIRARRPSTRRRPTPSSTWGWPARWAGSSSGPRRTSSWCSC